MFAARFQRIFRSALYGLALSAASATVTHAAADATVEQAAASLVAIKLLATAPLVTPGSPLDKEALRYFYGQRGYTLAWDGGNGAGLSLKASIAYAVLASADDEGLDPADYHVAEIAGLANASSVTERVNRDFLITDGLLRYAADVSSGKLEPGQSDERNSAAEAFDWPRFMASVVLLEPDRLAEFLRALPPGSPEYRALRDRLATLRDKAEHGAGWGALPDGPTIHPGAHDPAVPFLRDRLVSEGLIAPPGRVSRQAAADLYDPALSAAVASFQARHGIKPDGVLGKDTRAALDVPLDARIRQVVANMERARWTDIPTSGRMVEVNLAAFSLKVYQDGQPILAMPVVVGTPENQTPIISSRITTVVLNPNWTLPPNVIREMLPRIHSDQSYLAGKGIGRFESDGHVRLVQPPGPTNPLGHYKFVMPNDQDIYLHDSPDAAKFHYTLRAYSHGCVRLGNPAELAALLLDDRVGSLPESLADMTEGWETRHIQLSKPVPIALVYRTAWLDKNGELVLAEDGYGRDQRLWKALHKARGAAGSKRLTERAGQGNVL